MKEKLNNRYYKPKNDAEIDEIFNIYLRYGYEVHKGNIDSIFYIEAYPGHDGEYLVASAFLLDDINSTSVLTTIEELSQLVRENLREPATIAQTCETKQKLAEAIKVAERMTEIWNEVEKESPEAKMEREFGKRYVTISVRHGMNTYTGKRKLKTPEELTELKGVMAACASNKSVSFRLETEDGFVYFPAQILKKCVFSLVVEN